MVSVCFSVLVLGLKNAKFGVMMLNSKETEEAMMWFANVVVLLRFRSGRKHERWKVVIVQYLKVTAPLEAVVKSLGCICVNCSTSDEMASKVGGRELKHLVDKVVK